MKNIKKMLMVVTLMTFILLPKVKAETISVDPSMDSSEIEKQVINGVTIIFAEGTYENIHFNLDNKNVTFITTGSVTFLGDGTVGREGELNDGVTLTSSSILFEGDFTFSNYQNAIYVKAGTKSTVTIDKGTLTLSKQVNINNSVHEGNGIFHQTASDFTFNILNGAIVNIVDNPHAGITFYNYHKRVEINVTNGSILNASRNGKQGIYAHESDYFILNVKKNSTVNATENLLGITSENNAYLQIEDISTVNANNNKGIGINNFFIQVKASFLNANNNNSHGITNVSLDATNSKINTNNNAFLGLNITKYNPNMTSTNIIATEINSLQNGGAGIRFYTSLTNINSGSILTVKENGIGTSLYGYAVKPNDSAYWADIAAKGDVVTKESSIFCGTYSLYDVTSLASILYVNKDMIITLDKNDEFATSKDIFNDTNKTVDGRTIVVSGSLQGNLFDMTNGDSYTLNGVALVGEDYAAPINYDGTKLIRFDLNKEINKEVNQDGSNTFTYYDPYTNREYIYSFRYNKDGEDLIESEENNAYIWTPASIVNYDSTEGTIEYNESTAGQIVIGSSKTNQENNGLSDRYTQDITIFGNSLDLAEKIMPGANREGYIFLGWFIADDQEKAAQYAENEDWTNLYALLNTAFNASTKIEVDGVPVEELTVYAKWVKVETEIEKDGNDYVNQPNDAFDYEIKYNANIDNYNGDLIITIVDTMEYEILEDSSNISTGKNGITLSSDYEYEVETIYNREDKTITWIITIEDVNTSLNGKFSIDVTKNIKLYYVGIDNSIVEVTNKVNSDVIIINANNEEITTGEKEDEVITPILYKGSDIEELPPQTGVNETNNSIFGSLSLLLLSIIVLTIRKITTII